jgi:hypothetical protein
MTDIVVVNASRIYTDAEINSWITPLQKWDDNYLRPSWALDKCIYHFLPYGQMPDPNDTSIYPIFINNHSKDPGALGWHDDQAGKIYGRVFAGDCKRYGISVTVDLSHEAGETRVDPTINRFYTMLDGRIALVEVGDAVEDDRYGITVDNVLLTDFTMPDYFSNKTTGRFDFQDKLKAHCPALLPGGYMSLFQDGEWHQLTALYLNGPPSYRSIRFHNSHRRLRIPSLVP